MRLSCWLESALHPRQSGCDFLLPMRCPRVRADGFVQLLGAPLAKGLHSGAAGACGGLVSKLGSPLPWKPAPSQDPCHGLKRPPSRRPSAAAQSAEAPSERSETKVEPLCQFCVSRHSASRSVLAEIADMAELADVAKVSKSADFTGALRESGWCCQTGLNCRPLHYQWSARVLKTSRTVNHLSRLRSSACDTFVPVGQAFGLRAFGRIDLPRFHHRTLS
jgi:hypothetical protein